MILVTTEHLGEKKLEIIGMVKGATIQSVHMGKDFMNGLKTLVGGELTSYTEMMDTARGKATKRMCDDAEAMGADAVVGIRYTSSTITQGAAEVMVYGTAVKILD